jgi:ribosomal protein RSM22 (predicted rRNA methylase)
MFGQCPHDAACPLFHRGSSKLVCGFSQRIQRPLFVRRTKHSGVGHEDIGYSYVVIRRGHRPVSTTVNSGRIGAVGRSALVKESASRLPMKELQLHSENQESQAETGAESLENERGTVSVSDVEAQSPEALQESLRLEAYGWPRLVFPPLKRSGHIIIDSCTPEGKRLSTSLFVRYLTCALQGKLCV